MQVRTAAKKQFERSNCHGHKRYHFHRSHCTAWEWRFIEKARELGCGALCFEGNIDFYGKSGFSTADSFGIRYHGLPEGEDASFFLCKELIPGYLDGITGEYATPEGYFVDKEEVEAFDKAFPYKEKLALPGQLFPE